MRVYIPEPTVGSVKLRVHVARRPTRFAREVGCTVNSLKNWMNGYNRPSREWRERLAVVTGIDEGEWYIPRVNVGPAAPEQP
jgi:hypothetical protein